MKVLQLQLQQVLERLGFIGIQLQTSGQVLVPQSQERNMNSKNEDTWQNWQQNEIELNRPKNEPKSSSSKTFQPDSERSIKSISILSYMAVTVAGIAFVTAVWLMWM
jgi:hypothetical protein